SLGRGHQVRGECAGLVEPAQRAVDGGVAKAVQPGLAEPPHDVVAVAVPLRQDGQDREVEHALEQLGQVAGAVNAHVCNAWYYGLRSSRQIGESGSIRQLTNRLRPRTTGRESALSRRSG